jgi:hypothetical protein
LKVFEFEYETANQIVGISMTLFFLVLAQTPAAGNSDDLVQKQFGNTGGRIG